MIYITVADRVTDRFKVSLEQLKIALNGKSTKSMTIIAPDDYEFLIDGNIECDDINYFPEELNNLCIFIKYLIRFILEIVTLNPNVDATFKILSTFKDFQKSYNIHLNYFDNIDNIHSITRKMINRIALIEAIPVDDESYTQRLQEFIEEKDKTLLKVWKFELLNLLEDIIIFYHIDRDIKNLSEKIINESSKKNIQNVMKLSEQMAELKKRADKYDKFQLCHNLLDISNITIIYLYVHYFNEICSLYGKRKEDYIVFIPAVDFDSFVKINNIETMRRKIKSTHMTVATGFSSMYKEVDVYNYFATIQKAMEDKEKKEKLVIEDEKAKLATQKLLKEEAEAEAREKSKAKKKMEAEIKAKRKSEELRLKTEAEAKQKSEELRLKTEAEAEEKRKAEILRIKTEAEAEAKRKAEILRIKTEAEELRLKTEAEAKRKEEILRLKTEAEELRIKTEAEAEAKRKAEILRLETEAEAEAKISLLENPIQISISPPSTIVDDSHSVSSVYSEQTFYYTIENMPEMEYVYNDPTFYIKYPNAYIFHLINNCPNNFHPTDLAIFHQISALGTLHYAYTSIPDIPEYLPAKMFNFASYNTHLHNINTMIYNRTYE